MRRICNRLRDEDLAGGWGWGGRAAVFFYLFSRKPSPIKCPNTHFSRVEKGRTNQDSQEAGHTEAPLKPLKKAEFGKLEFLLQFQQPQMVGTCNKGQAE